MYTIQAYPPKINQNQSTSNKDEISGLMKTGKEIWKGNKVLLWFLHAKYDNTVTNKLLG